ncbi:hypothetical protein D5086_027339 [Populus alba]|uniref:Uncharacterized protein n=1 Tax=Populus alba TaxID=43335 RepID=A0ACC4AV97_POPAL
MKTEIFYMASDAHKGEGIPLIYGFSAFCSIMIVIGSNGYLSSLLIKFEMGRRYFPNCSQVLDKFMEDDLPDLFYHEKGTPDEQRIKKTRFMELKEDVQRAFTKKQKTMNIVLCLGKTKNYEC